MAASRTLGRRGKPPKVNVLGKELAVTVKGVTLKFQKGLVGLRRVDRNVGVSKDEVAYAKQVVAKYLESGAAEAQHNLDMASRGVFQQN